MKSILRNKISRFCSAFLSSTKHTVHSENINSASLRNAVLPYRLYFYFSSACISTATPNQLEGMISPVNITLVLIIRQAKEFNQRVTKNEYDLIKIHSIP